MKKITVAIGQSAAGKTTFVMNEIIKDNKLALVGEPVPHTVFEGCCLLGDYTCSERTKGTDRLSYSIMPKLIEFITDNSDKIDHLVAEGDRINCERFFQFLKTFNVPVTVHVFLCDIELSVQRRIACGSGGSQQFVQATQTKTLNSMKLVKNLGFEVIVHDARTKSKAWW